MSEYLRRWSAQRRLQHGKEHFVIGTGSAFRRATMLTKAYSDRRIHELRQARERWDSINRGEAA